MDLIGLIRAALGFVYILFIPGFVATWALFPKKGEIDSIERVALSLGLSLALSTLPVMFLNYFGVPVNAVNVFFIILGVVVACGVAAAWRMRVFSS